MLPPLPSHTIASEFLKFVREAPVLLILLVLVLWLTVPVLGVIATVLCGLNWVAAFNGRMERLMFKNAIQKQDELRQQIAGAEIELGKLPHSKVPLALIEQAIKTVGEKWKGSDEAVNIVKLELRQARKLTLDSEEIQNLNRAYEVKEYAESYLKKRTYRPVSGLSEADLIEAFRVKFGENGQMTSDASGTMKFINYKKALEIISDLESQASLREVSFDKLTEKRASFNEAAQLFQRQVLCSRIMAEISSELFELEKNIALQAGTLGEQYLANRNEYSQIEAEMKRIESEYAEHTEDFPYRSKEVA